MILRREVKDAPATDGLSPERTPNDSQDPAFFLQRVTDLKFHE